MSKQNDNVNLDNKTKFKILWEKNGFYIVLFVCLVVLALTAIITNMVNNNATITENENIDNKDISQNKSHEQMTTLSPYSLEQIKILQQMNDVNSLFVKEKNEDTPQTTTDDKTTTRMPELTQNNNAIVPEKAIIITKEVESSQGNVDRESNLEMANTDADFQSMLQQPLEGKILRDYSSEIPLFWRSMNYWRVHVGIDVHALVDDDVLAIDDGVVLSISDDVLWGVIVTIEHQNGMIAKYASLSEAICEVGKDISKGDIIGKPGVCDSEKDLGIHLHIEISRDNEKINPLEILAY